MRFLRYVQSVHLRPSRWTNGSLWSPESLIQTKSGWPVFSLHKNKLLKHKINSPYLLQRIYVRLAIGTGQQRLFMFEYPGSNYISPISWWMRFGYEFEQFGGSLFIVCLGSMNKIASGRVIVHRWSTSAHPSCSSLSNRSICLLRDELWIQYY